MLGLWRCVSDACMRVYVIEWHGKLTHEPVAYFADLLSYEFGHLDCDLLFVTGYVDSNFLW